MIGLEHLNVIYVIHREGSFRKASEKLFKARSAVSYSVKQVEQYYDVEIFDRSSYRPKLTAEGKALLAKIRPLIAAADEFEHFAQRLSGEVETEIRISISAIFPTDKVTLLLHSLRENYPETEIHLSIETASGERMLKDDVVDIGIYAVRELDEDRIAYKQIDSLNLPVYVSDQFPLAKKSEISQQDLYQYPQVVVKSSYKSSPDSGIITQAKQWYVSDHNTKKTLIKSGLGWGRLACHEVEGEAHHWQRVVAMKAMTVPIYIARTKSKPMGPVAQRIWDFFESVNNQK